MAIKSPELLTERGVTGALNRIAPNYATQLALVNRVAKHWPSTMLTDQLAFVGRGGGLQTGDGAINFENLTAYDVILMKERVKRGIEISRKNAEFDRFALLEEEARRVSWELDADWWNRLITLLEAGTSGIAYDGTAFFSAARTEGSNLESLSRANAPLSAASAAGTNDNPSPEEAQYLLGKAAETLRSLKDEKGFYPNSGARRFQVICPLGMEQSYINAATNNMAVGQTNQVMGAGYEFSVQGSPELTATDEFYLLNMDSDMAFVKSDVPVTSEDATTKEVFASDYVQRFAVNSFRAMTYWAWYAAGKFTITA